MNNDCSVMKLGFTGLLHLPLQQQNIEHGCCRFTH